MPGNEILFIKGYFGWIRRGEEFDMPVIVICDENGNFVIENSQLKDVELAKAILNGDWQQPQHLKLTPPYFIVQRGDLTFLTNPNKDPKPQHPKPDLTPQENQVLQCLGNGLSVEMTAHNLHISVRTVRAYLEKLKEKFNAHSRDQLMAMAGYLGYFDPPESDQPSLKHPFVIMYHDGNF